MERKKRPRNCKKNGRNDERMEWANKSKKECAMVGRGEENTWEMNKEMNERKNT